VMNDSYVWQLHLTLRLRTFVTSRTPRLY
jgi:hypothetical protein